MDTNAATSALDLIFDLARVEARPVVSAALARRLGGSALYAFVRDQELSVLVPAPGFPQTHPGGPAWRSFLARCQSVGFHHGEVAYPRPPELASAWALCLDSGAVFAFIGEHITLGAVEQRALGVVGTLLTAEHAAVVADGAAMAARKASEHSSRLTTALDGARGELKSALTESARLNLELQKAADRAATPATPATPATNNQAVTKSRAGRRAMRVLLVDDNEDIVELLSAALEISGYTTASVHDGPSALRMASEFKPDVAVLDIGLPVMDGYELARRLRELPGLESLRLVALTGYGHESARARSSAAGFDEHVIKPIRLEALQSVFDRLQLLPERAGVVEPRTEE